MFLKPEFNLENFAMVTLKVVIFHFHFSYIHGNLNSIVENYFTENEEDNFSNLSFLQTFSDVTMLSEPR